MKKKLRSLKAVRKNWWWNKIRRDKVPGVDWPLVEIAARNYELARRSERGGKLPLTYLELGREEKTIVHCLWVNWRKNPYRIVISNKREEFQEIGWTPVSNEYWHRQWNLRLSDKKLTDEFIREIRLLRKIQKIPTPRRNKGKKHRGVSWKLVEILDRQQNQLGKLNDSERHTASIAQKLAEKYFKEHKHAVKKRLETCRASPDLDGEYADADEEPENPFTDAPNR